MTSASRPFCQQVSACAAKTPGKHCVRCAALDPEVRARKSRGIRAALDANPAERARRAQQAAALSRDAATVERRTKAIGAAFARPEVRAAHSAACKARRQELMKDPVFAARVSQWGRDFGSKNMAAAWTPEAKEKSRQAIQAAHLGWCPQEFWPLNAELKAKGIRLPERKRLIAEEIERASPEAAARRAIAQFDQEQRARERRRLAQAY